MFSLQYNQSCGINPEYIYSSVQGTTVQDFFCIFMQDGAYLVRPSSTSKGKFVLSLLYGGRITHARCVIIIDTYTAT